MTLDEFHAQLKREGKWEEFVARKAERQAAFERRAAELAVAEAPLIAELRSVGCDVQSVYDLVNRSGGGYGEAIPTLLKHLQRQYPDVIRAGIARALGVPEARTAWDLLVRQFRVELGPETRHGLGVALANIASDEHFDEILDLLRDARLGDARIFLLEPLSTLLPPQGFEAVKSFEHDHVLGKETRRLLRKWRSRRPLQ